MAYSKFCLENPSYCMSQSGSPEWEQTSSAQRSAQLESVNGDVNRAITPEPNFGGLQNEKWTISPPSGDCNDYAVTKQAQLIDSGWPSSQVLLAEVSLPNGEHHLVDVVTDNKTGAVYVLDNLAQHVVPINQTNYMWWHIQSPADPQFWSKLRPR